MLAKCRVDRHVSLFVAHLSAPFHVVVDQNERLVGAVATLNTDLIETDVQQWQQLRLNAN